MIWLGTFKCRICDEKAPCTIPSVTIPGPITNTSLKIAFLKCHLWHTMTINTYVTLLVSCHICNLLSGPFCLLDVWASKESKLKQQEIFPSLHFPPLGCFQPTPSNTKILSLKAKKCSVEWELKIRKLLSWEKSFSNLLWITLFDYLTIGFWLVFNKNIN